MDYGDKLLRLAHIIGDPAKGIEPLVPVGRSTIYQWVKDGRFPEPYIRKGRFTAWRASDVRDWIEQQGAK